MPAVMTTLPCWWLPLTRTGADTGANRSAGFIRPVTRRLVTTGSRPLTEAASRVCFPTRRGVHNPFTTWPDTRRLIHSFAVSQLGVASDGTHERMKQRHLISLLLLSTLFWVVLSMMFKGYLLVLGVASIGVTAWLCARMQIIDEEGQPLPLLLRIPGYWLWLMGQVVISNIAVCRAILRGSKAIQPQMVEVSLDPQLSSVSHATIANSITLTPGTVTIEADSDTLLVHALTDQAADEVRQGHIAARVARMEQRAP